ncbi:hypothetical protein BS17DRAFT_762300 [Gyrodon lividus]|nr:hypothetical protein BS17DRAFT_762300 [Gyrodon lividus]
MLSKHVLLSSAVSLVLGSVALSQSACHSTPLCCQYVYDVSSPNVTSVMSQVDIAPTSVDVVFPVAINCVPIENPPAEYILVCTSPREQVCCKHDQWGGEIAFGCDPDAPISIA